MQSEDSSIDEEGFAIQLVFETNIPTEDEGSEAHLHLVIEGLFQPVVDIDKIKPEVVERFKNVEALSLLQCR